jgi:DNA repair protein RAD50
METWNFICIQAAQRLTDLKKDIREVASLKQSAITVSRNQNETERLKSDIKNLETELAATGTAKTGDDVQRELDVLSNEMYVVYLP